MDKNSPDWLIELHILTDRYPHFGFAADLTSLTTVEAYALLIWLRRIYAVET